MFLLRECPLYAYWAENDVTDKLQVPGILAQLVSRGASGQEYGKSWAMEVMSSITSNMALLYSMLFAEMIHARVKSGNSLRSPWEFEVGTRATQLISHEMRNPARARLDSSIWAVVLLGFSGKEAPLRTGPKYPRQSFLKELQDLHIYCKMEIVLEHVLGLVRLIELVGGLQNVKTPGMAQIISLYVLHLHTAVAAILSRIIYLRADQCTR